VIYNRSVRRASWGIALLIGLAGCDLLLGLSPIPAPKPPVDAPPVVHPWTAVASGFWHSCALTADQKLWCWGRNDSLEIDPAAPVLELDTPMQVGTDTWTAISAASFHTCGIHTDQTLWCWGENSAGQLGTGTFTQPPTAPLQIAGTWKAVATGYNHTCAIAATGALWCWGDDSTGELGDNAPIPGALRAPMQIDAGPWIEVTSGYDFSCAIRGDGTLWCWGANYADQLGNPGNTAFPVPTQVDAQTWTHVAAGEPRTDGEVSACGIHTDGTLWCWGSGHLGQIGDDDTPAFTTMPVEVVGHATWTLVGVGAGHACGIQTNGSLWCWGLNEYGELLSDTGAETFKSSPTQVTGASSKWTALGLGASHTCAIDDAQGLWCGGNAGAGETAMLGSHPQPTQVAGAWQAASAGTLVTCAYDGNGATSCWGDNDHGAVGDGTTSDRDVPTPVLSNGTRFQSVAVSDHVCAIDGTPSNSVWCWGSNVSGGVGNNSMTDQPTPVTPGVDYASAIAVSDHTCALQQNSFLYCWGANDQGQCTAPASGPLPNPVSIGSGLTAISAGNQSTCAISLAGNVECWGYNAYGEYGDDTNVTNTSINTVPLMGGPWTSVVSGERFNCAVSTDAWCWGDDQNGQLANQGTNIINAPVKVQADAKAFAAGFDHTCAIVAGALYCAGGNAFGQLGIGSFDEHHEMVQVGTDTNWKTVTTGYEHTCATKTDASLWCWGRNDRGQLGDGTGWSSAATRVP